MKLRAAQRHLRRSHSECWSCRLEKLMVEAMMTGHGFIIERSL
jgi:hypothetical protein